jgi:acetyl esterase/lipase
METLIRKMMRRALSLAVEFFKGLEPRNFKVIKDIDYLMPPAPEKADIYLPVNPSAKLRPAIVVIHGGGWVEGDKQNPRELNICADLAYGDFVVLSINYVLFKADNHRSLWPESLYQCKTAVRWLRKNASEYRIDADHIGVLGESVGGQLASMVALTGPQDGLDPIGPYPEYSCLVQAAVDLYGPADLRMRDKLLPVLGKTPGESPELYAQASPASYGDKTGPPILIIHGTADETVDVKQSTDFAAALEKVGAPHELLLVLGAPHAFDLRPEQMDLRPAVLGFFDRYLRP